MTQSNEFFLRKADAYKMIAEAKTEAQVLIERLNMMITDLVMCDTEEQLQQYGERYSNDFLLSGFKHISL